MRRVRSNLDEPRLEVMPLVDVIFLLLTFFVFAMVLMVRADALDVALPRLGAGEPVERGELITIAIRDDGSVFVNGDAVPIETVGEETARRIAERPPESAGVRVVIAADERGATRELLRVLDALAGAGVGDVAIMGRPAEGPDPATAPN